MSTGFKGPIVHAPSTKQGLYPYRSGMAMAPCAEFDVFHDDFHSFVVATAITNGPVANTPWGWQGAVIDTGATAVVDTTAVTGASGALLMSDATASEGVAIYGTKSVQLTSGKKFFMEMRVQTGDVSDNTVQFGLSDLTATTNPEDLYTTAAANVVALGLLDTNGAYPVLLSDAGNGGTTIQTQTEKVMVASTWHVLGIAYDGTKLRAYIDGKEIMVWSGAAATIPTGVALAPFFAVRNGDGAGAAVNYIDYIRFVVER